MTSPPRPEDSHFLVVGLARNAAQSLTADVARTADVLKFADRISWLVIESDSEDETLSTLEELATRYENFRVVSLGTLRDTLPKRTERIAHCRNAYLDLVAQDYADVDYVILSDMDNLNQKLTTQGVLSCWERDDWGACTANQSGRYYDIFALRHDAWCPNDCAQQQAFMAQHGAGFIWSRLASVYLKMLRIPQDADWIEVRSSFGGFAIYRRDALLAGRYTGTYPDGREICEHVPFHAMLREAGWKLFINPRLINAHYTDHMPWGVALRKFRHYRRLFLERVGLKAPKT
ncbi:hypothetical protein [Primorskyibacter sp. S187A]|uniref:hypothetical protein n=1 Tax=Primorskyibacter sp. S187A TaxID=3415130 RepID=UPI003C7B9B19